ncbi:TetR/AcrR family transcriptional regulator [Arthrobacter sp. N199823]|uniref:TetR/AcrR family transcriptional regulator n=1 Tax=Arthrobacter sp. N199823 TaxID=2058895 RepID=UPI0015E3C52A|nr:TetR/AcrR family transcriptional regulator [Arthrobacter sp. N199823]
MDHIPRTRLSPDARRQQILDAAAELYRERRYDDVSLEELAASAGVARGLLHHYFGSKRELFLAVMTASARLPLEQLPDLAGRPIAERATLTMSWILDGAHAYGQSWVNASGAERWTLDNDVQALVDAADDRAARFMLDALGLPDDAGLRPRLRPVAAFTKALCREWLQRKTLTRDDVLELSTAAVLRAVRVN